MKRILLKTIFVICAALTAASAALAQPDHDVAHWLDRDTTLVINIDDVPATYENISSLDLFSNPRFLKALKMLSDERFPVVDEESCQQILLRLYELESLIRKVDQISVAVHDIDEKAFHWSVFVRADGQVLDVIKKEMQGIDNQLKTEDAPKDKQAGDPESNQPAATSDEPDSEGVRWGEFQRAEQWLVFSNHEAFLKTLPDRIGDENFRSLGKSRKYRAINKRESPLSDSPGLITVYGNPVRMRYLVPHSTQNDWEFGEIDELPACGLNLGFTDSGDEDKFQPIILADAVIKFTQPAVGQAKIFEHYRALEIPPLAVEPIELLAFARDEEAVAKEWKQIYDRHQGIGAAEVIWGQQLLQLEIDCLTGAVPRRDAFFEMRFLDEQHPVDRPGFVSLEKLNDREAAHRYVNQVIGVAENLHQRTLDEQQDGSFISWTIPRDQFPGNSSLQGFDRKRHAQIQFFNSWHDAYVLTEDWWVQGDMPATKNQVDLITTGEGEDHAQPIRELLEDLTRRLRGDGPPLMLKYFTAAAWQENLNNVEQQYANANSRPMRFKLNVVAGEGKSRSFVLVAEEDDSAKPEQGSSPSVIEVEMSEAPKIVSDRKPSRVVVSNLQNLQLMIPMPLGQRNEDGHRIPLKRREDLEVAIRVMILKSLAEAFPRQLYVYTRNDQHIRIMMGAYPDEDVDDSQNE